MSHRGTNSEHQKNSLKNEYINIILKVICLKLPKAWENKEKEYASINCWGLEQAVSLAKHLIND